MFGNFSMELHGKKKEKKKYKCSTSSCCQTTHPNEMSLQEIDQKHLHMWMTFVLSVPSTVSHFFPNGGWEEMAPLPDFHGNLHFYRNVFLDIAFCLTMSAICRPNMQVCFGLHKRSIGAWGGSRRRKGWQSTKQIPSTCFCKLFMLLMHYASGMRRTQITQHCFMFSLHVSRWFGSLTPPEFCLAPILRLCWAQSLTRSCI